MKNIFSMFLPFILFLFFTLVLFFYLKNDNADINNNNNVKEIFEDVKVKKESIKDKQKKIGNLEVTRVRWHRHDGFERLVFDVNGDIEGTFEIGTDAGDNTKLYGKFLGYSAFLATLPSFSSSTIIKDMEVSSKNDTGYTFRISLYRPTEYKIFALKNPARIVIDMY